MSLLLAARDYDTNGKLKSFVSPVRIIDSYINSRSANSKNTKEEYTFDIKQFFKAKTGKDIEHLTEADLEVDLMEIEEYRIELKENYSGSKAKDGYAGSSINRKISTLRGLYEYFENFYKNNVNITSSAFNVKALKHDVRHYGSVSTKEIEAFCELALQERFKPWEKHYLIKLAQRTSFRIEVMLNLSWNDIQKHDFRDDTYLVTSRAGKGMKTHIRPIHKDFYEELLTLKQKYPKNYGDNKIFHLNDMDVSRMMKRFCESLEISEERNVKFHSIRRFGSNFIKNATGDITLAQEQLDHTDIRTTMIYTDAIGNVDLSVGMLLDSKQDDSIIENMTAEDWKEMFMNASKETQLNLMLNAKK